MNKKKCSLATISVATVILFILVSILFKPGELDLINPQHSDLFRYFILSESRWLPENWMAPRPLMLAYLKLAGIFHRPEILFLFLALPAIAFVAVLANLATRIGLSSGVYPVIALGVVVFGSPLFYPTFQYDFGGMLGGLFAVLAVQFGLKAVKDGGASLGNWWVAPLLFTIASVESKPTYALSLLSLAFVAAIFIQGRRSKWLFVGVLAVLIWVFIKDKLLGSPFVASSDPATTYAVIIDPIRNLHTLVFYLTNAFTGPLALATLLASVVLVAHREWKLLATFAVLSVSASMPMALLVNRQWDIYSLYSTIMVGVLIMVAVSRLLLVTNSTHNLKNKVLAAAAVMIIGISLIAHALSRHGAIEWTIANQQYNRNVLSSLGLIDNEYGEQKILLAGIQGPYHPLKNTAFVERIFPKVGRFDVLLRNNERAWNEMSHEQTNGLYRDEVDWAGYSFIYIFNENGYVAARRAAAEIANMSRYERALLLYCGEPNMVSVSDPQVAMKAIECLNNNEEFEDSIVFGRISADLGEKQPWIYFHLAKSYQATGNAEMAVYFLQKAVKLEPGNPLFISALTENQSKKDENQNVNK